jgi:hypothetical protein
MGLKFSPDGVLLIAHSGSQNDNFIAVLNVATGNVLSARVYKSGSDKKGSYESYNNGVKSILVSSGGFPMAYVLSNIKDSDSSCYGQRLFKFDPLTFTSTP